PGIPVHQRHGDIAAEHRKSRVREVDEIHHPQRHRQADRQQEEEHAVGQPVEQDAEHRPHDDRPYPAATIAARRYFFSFSGSLTSATLSNSTLTRLPPTFSTRRIKMVMMMSRVYASMWIE